jgi:hypothetical protein
MKKMPTIEGSTIFKIQMSKPADNTETIFIPRDSKIITTENSRIPKLHKKLKEKIIDLAKKIQLIPAINNNKSPSTPMAIQVTERFLSFNIDPV